MNGRDRVTFYNETNF